jgi:hypothetical protein
MSFNNIFKMVIILPFSVSAPLSSVKMCRNTVQRRTVCIRSLNWLGTCCCLCSWGRLRLLPSAVVKGSLQENSLPDVVLGTLRDILFDLSALTCLQPLRPPTCSCSMSVSMLCCPLRAFLVQFTNLQQHKNGNLRLAQAWPKYRKL